MSLKCGIVGLTNSGKTTIFNCFSNTKAEVTNYSFSTTKSNIGIAYVPDNRLNELEKIQATEKVIKTTIEFVDIPGLAKGSSKGEGIGNTFLSDIRNVDAIIHVIRCFDDDNLMHVEGSIDPVRDIETLNFELQVNDLEIIERKKEKLQKLVKTGDKDAKKGVEVLNKYIEHLENFQSADSLEINENEKKYIEDVFLLTNKPVLYVCNVDDESAATGNKYVEAVKKFLSKENKEIITVAAQLEAEISELELDDQEEFLKDANLSEPSVNKLIRSAYNLLNLQTFFTIGPKEIRAWTIKKGINAQKAAGAIHSDLERGFIRAEIISYDDLIELGSEQACKEKGKFRLEGKGYIMQEADLVHVRFNV